MHRHLTPQMTRRVKQLIDATYSGRDELYAAASTLDDQKRSNVCRQLADHLAGHAAELQQLLLANGEDTVEPLDIYTVAETFFSLAKNRDGEAGVLTVAEECERVVGERFDNAIDAIQDGDTTALLQKQRDNIEFGEDVLRSMQDSPEP